MQRPAATLALLVSLLFSAAANAAAQLADDQKSAIDEIVGRVLAETRVPAASLAVVKDGQVAMIRAYGDAKLDPKTPATPSMRFKIAWNSKQFAATAALLLAEQHKLSLKDPLSRYFPQLTRAKEVTLRELLSHTSGYQDYYPLDYVAPFMTKPVTPSEILDRWGRIPLNFDPGTRWQYSNTGYVIVGQVIEKVTGKSLIGFLRQRIFEPLGMKSVIDQDSMPWPDTEPTGYLTHALGPARPAPAEGRGWLYAAGELAMTAEDLALWDVSLIDGTILKPASLKELTAATLLKNGSGAGYGLGLNISADVQGHRRWSHGGEAGGFVSQNVTLPDDRIAIAVLTNGEGPAASAIEQQIEHLLLERTADTGAAAALEHAKALFTGLQKGEVDPSLLTSDAVFYFSAQTVADFKLSLGPLGAPTNIREAWHAERGGMTERGFRITAGEKDIALTTYVTPDGKFAQYLIAPVPSQP